MKKMFILLFLAVTFTTSAFAADGSSGCGPGWYIMKDNSILSSALRATTNGVLGITVTVGMTFGTSNCTKHSIVKREMESIKFVTENYFEIASDTAKGNGKFVEAFGTTMGCHSGSLSLFKQQMKRNYGNVIDLKTINPKEMILNTYKVILQNKKLTKTCILS